MSCLCVPHYKNNAVSFYKNAEVVELADTLALGASARKSLRVRLPLSALLKPFWFLGF